MILRFSIIVFSLCSHTLMVFGQEYTDSQTEEYEAVSGIYQLGITPSALFNKYPGIQISQRLKVYKPIYIGLESAVLFYMIDWDFERARGFRIRPSLQLKVYNREKITGHIGVFYNYRKTKAFREVETQRANGNFIQIIDGHLDSKLSGWGLQFDLVFNEDLPNFSLSMGLGMGNITNVYSNQDIVVNRFFGDNVNAIRNGEYILFFYALHYRLPLF
ncbi:MAG: hypothetical protein EA409_08765 [Saprospirales bacterium]|nr:MAG: hypothetical protein EA409_08765 [Saprospirales bacterium]